MERVGRVREKLLNRVYVRLLAYKRMLMFLQADLKTKKRKDPCMVKYAIKFLTIIYKSRSRDQVLIKEAAAAAAVILSLKDKYTSELAKQAPITNDESDTKETNKNEKVSNLQRPSTSRINWELPNESTSEISTSSKYPMTPRIIRRLVIERPLKIVKPAIVNVTKPRDEQKTRKQRQTSGNDGTASSLECSSTSGIEWNLPEKTSSETGIKGSTTSNYSMTPRCIWKYLNGTNLKILKPALIRPTNFNNVKLSDELKQSTGSSLECSTKEREQSDKTSMEAVTIEVGTANSNPTINKNVGVRVTTSTVLRNLSDDETSSEAIKPAITRCTITNKNVTKEISDKTSLEVMKLIGVNEFSCTVSCDTIHNENIAEVNSLARLSAYTINWEISDETEISSYENLEEKSCPEYFSISSVEQDLLNKISLVANKPTQLPEVSSAVSYDATINENVAKVSSLARLSATTINWEVPDEPEVGTDEDLEEVNGIDYSSISSVEQNVLNQTLVVENKLTQMFEGSSTVSCNATVNKNVAKVNSLVRLRTDTINWETSDQSSLEANNPVVMADVSSTFNSCAVINYNIAGVKSLKRLSDSAITCEISNETSLKAIKPPLMTEFSSYALISENVAKENSLAYLSTSTINWKTGETSQKAIKYRIAEVGTASSDSLIENVEKESSLDCCSVSTIEQDISDISTIKPPVVLSEASIVTSDRMNNKNIEEGSFECLSKVSTANSDPRSNKYVAEEIPDEMSVQEVKSAVVAEVGSDPMSNENVEEESSLESSSTSSQEEEILDEISIKAIKPAVMTKNTTGSDPISNENDREVSLERPSTSKIKWKLSASLSLQEFKPALTKVDSFTSRNPITNSDYLEANCFKRSSTSRISRDSDMTKERNTISNYPMTPRSIRKLLSGSQLKTLKPAVRKEIFGDVEVTNEKIISRKNGEAQVSQYEYPTTADPLPKLDTLPQSDLMSMLLRYKQKKGKRTDN